MRMLLPDEVRRAVHGLWLTRGPDRKIEGISIDSRTAKPGDLFVAIKGDRYDGHDYLAEAAKAGCVAGVVRRDPKLPREMLDKFPVGCVGVEDTVTALGELAAFCRRHAPASAIAVTGSNGKTTVKRMIHHLLSRRLTGSCSEKSFNNAIGVPLTLFAVEPGDDYVICEIGSNKPGEVSILSRIVKPDVAVVTCVGRSHLASLHDLAHVAVEKASILTGLTDQSLAVVNADCEQLDRALLAYNCNTIRFGLADSAALRLTGCTPLEEGQRIEINGRFCMDMAIPGRHNALNALAAMAVAQRFGMDHDEIAASLADFTGLESRLEFIHLPSGTIIDDTYNANPDSVMAAAAVLADCRARRRVIIAGDMLELGQKSQSLHIETGRDLAATGVDLLIGVGPLGRYIAEGAAKKGTKTEVFDSQSAAAAAFSKLLHAGDTVLVKGSRAMEMERLIKPIKSALGSRRPRAKKVSVAKKAKAKKAKAKKKVKARKKAKKTTTP